MLLVLLSVIGLAVAEQSSTPDSAPVSGYPPLHVHHSLLSSVLQVAGYSDTCVAAALDACSPVSEQYQHSSLIKEARGVLQDVSLLVNKSESRPHHCKDLLDSGDSGSGLRLVYPYPGQPHHRVNVYCDHTVDGGGWTVFQRRTNNAIRQDFRRTFIEYQLGFGDLEGEFWLGLDLLHVLTSTTLQQLRINMADYEAGERFAKYGFFNVGSPETKYRLSIGRYSGDAGDAIAGHHHGSSFSTPDADHDKHSSNCAQSYRGGWWYASCHHSNLNGYQHQGNHTSFADGINWQQWRGYHYSLRQTSMMIRPAF